MKKTIKQKITDYINSLSDELRSLINHRKNKPRTPNIRKLGRLVIILCCVIYLLLGCFGVINSNASEPSSSPPSNLSGYQVVLPGGWSAPPSTFLSDIYSEPVVSLYSYLTESFHDFYGMGVGFYGGPYPNPASPRLDSFTLASPSGFYSNYLTGSGRYIFNFLANPDAVSFYSDTSLIQWFVDNDATFEYIAEPTVTLSAGLYFGTQVYQAEVGIISFDTPFISKSNYFGSIEFNAVDGGVDINYVDVDDDITNVYYPGEGWRSNEYVVIYLQNDEVLTEAEFLLFDNVFLSSETAPDLAQVFTAGQENGQSVGYSQGYNVGRTEGYNEGFYVGKGEGQSEGFMSSFFGGIVQALDALKLFGDISLLNIIESVLGIMLALFILKLIAGG